MRAELRNRLRASSGHAGRCDKMPRARPIIYDEEAFYLRPLTHNSLLYLRDGLHCQQYERLCLGVFNILIH